MLFSKMVFEFARRVGRGNTNKRNSGAIRALGGPGEEGRFDLLLERVFDVGSFLPQKKGNADSDSRGE